MLVLELEPESNGPLHLRIARGVARAIRAGQLRANQALPSARALAEQVGTHRNTVTLAYQELEAEGWVNGRQGSGTFVAAAIPELTPMAWGAISNSLQRRAEDPGFDLPSRTSPLCPVQATAFDFERAARPDGRLAPYDDLARAVARGMRLHGFKLMQDADPLGHPLLREQFAEWLARRRGFTVAPDQVLLTRGGRMGLGLVLAALFPKGGVLAVESPGNPGIQEVVQQRPGLHVQGIPMDGQGMDMEALEAAVMEQGVRAVLVAPHAQQPTGVTLSAQRRAKLAAIAQAHRLAILEEDSDGEHHYEGRRPKPLAASDSGGQVIHLGSLSRLVAPELRIGFIVATRDLISRLARVRQQMESHGDPALEWALGDLMRDGLLDSHLLRVRRVYLERRDLLAAHLRELAGDPFTFELPQAGLAIWLKAKDPATFDNWLARARTCGVRLESGAHFMADGRPCAATRMGFGSMDESELEAAFGLLRAI